MNRNAEGRKVRGALLAAIALTGFTTGMPSAAQQAEDVEELETVLVTGEHPGPGLWKVSKGDHVMWVLGTHSPLPKGMTWRSQHVEARIAESQEVLLPGEVDMQFDPGVGFFKLLSLIPSMMKTDNLPGGKTLKDVLPAETYGNWRVLRDKYLKGSRSAEKSRPSFAIWRLRDAAYRKQRLTDGPVVTDIVKAAAKKRKVKVQRLPDVKPRVRVENFEALLKHIRSLENPDLECFTTSLGRVESDIEHMKALANAWAHGDVEALRDLHRQPEVGTECDDVMELALTVGDSAIAESTRQFAAEYERREAQGRRELEAAWIRAARTALYHNRSTFAVLPIRELVSTEGYVAKLKELGYEVEGQ